MDYFKSVLKRQSRNYQNYCIINQSGIRKSFGINKPFEMINQELGRAQGRKYVLPNFRSCCNELWGLKVMSFRACVHSFFSIFWSMKWIWATFCLSVCIMFVNSYPLQYLSIVFIAWLSQSIEMDAKLNYYNETVFFKSCNAKRW